jgi:acyl-CoA thioester hydrolase
MSPRDRTRAGTGERPQPGSRQDHSDPARAIDEIQVRVYYEDTDAAGMVYHASYLRFAERGRTEMLRRIGFGQRRLREEGGVGFAVRRCAVDYRAPARLDDVLTVQTRVVDTGAATLSMRQEIRRDDEIIVAVDVLVACIGREGRPRRLPIALRRALGCDDRRKPGLVIPMSN